MRRPTNSEVVVLPQPRFTFDKIIIVSTASKMRLEEVLPIADLQRLCPDFKVHTRRSGPSFYQSNIQFVYKPQAEFWNLLIEHESKLQIYRFYQIELAFDFPAPDEASALETGQELAFSLRKLWHKRRTTEIRYDPDTSPPEGIIHGPTFYYEDGPSSTRLKVYARYPKFGPRQHQPVARLECQCPLSGVKQTFASCPLDVCL